MKRMGWVLLVGLLAIAFLPAGAWARVVEPWEARNAGEGFLNQIMKTEGGWGTANNAHVLDCVEFTGEEGRLGYFLPVHPKGYIMVSLLTQLLPIKAWSAECNLDITEEGGMTQLLRDVMGGTLDYLEDTYGSLDQLPEEGIAPASNREEWDFLWGKGPQPLGENGEPRSSLAVGGLLTASWFSLTTGELTSTLWGQSTPYNNNCPLGYSSQRTLAGCGPIAVAQIMKFWNYPQSGTGSHSYHWDGDTSCSSQTVPAGGATLSATFSDTYDWANMLNSYSGGYNATQAAAVAELCYEAGIALDDSPSYPTDYGVCGTNAWMSTTVFPTYFKYASTTDWRWRGDYTFYNWFAEIRKEFDGCLPRPIKYRILNHFIVCDGYSTNITDRIHVNYGWLGGHSDWFSPDNIYGDSNPTVEDYMVIGIQPQNRLYSLVRGTNNSIYQTYMKSNGTLGVAQRLSSGQTSFAPALTVFYNRLYAAVKGSSNNNIYVSSRSHTFNWTSWNQIPGLCSRSPALAAFNNRLYMAVRGASNSNIYLKSMRSSGAWDASWTTVAGLTGDSPALAFFNNKLYLAVKGATNNQIYVKSMSDTGAWTGWSVVPGATNCAPALAVFNDRLFLAVKGATNNNIYVKYMTTAGTWSASWTTVPGLTSTSPALAAMPETNRLYLAVKGAANNNIYAKYMNSSWTWSASWTTLLGLTPDTPPVHVFYDYNP